MRNPFGRKWSLRVRAIADWSGTDLMIVRVRVYDAERAALDRRRQGLFWRASSSRPSPCRSARSPCAGPSLSATVLDSDGLIRELGWRDVSGLIAAVSADAPAPPSVTFDFDAPRLRPRAGIEKVAVFVDYPTAAGGEAETDFAFTADGQVRHLPLEPAPASGAEIGYQAVALHADGRRHPAGPRPHHPRRHREDRRAGWRLRRLAGRAGPLQTWLPTTRVSSCSSCSGVRSTWPVEEAPLDLEEHAPGQRDGDGQLAGAARRRGTRPCPPRPDCRRRAAGGS